MTAGAVEACGALMYILMTFVTVSLCFLKYQSRMTLLAADLGMLPDQGQFGSVMVKRINFFIELPSFSTMTGFTADLKSRTMWRIGLLVKKEKPQAENQK